MIRTKERKSIKSGSLVQTILERKTDFVFGNKIKNKKQEEIIATPYSSYQRDSNENVHRLFRYFIPKGKDISKYTPEQIQEIFNLINNYPRKRLNYSTLIKELAKELGDNGIEILNKLGYYIIEIEDLKMKMF